MSRWGHALPGTAAWLAVLALVSTARAQDAQQRQAAAEAYDRGTTAYLAERWDQAAQYFETAHRLAPAAAALVQATRARVRAGDDLRAANLALRLSELYPGDDNARATSAELLPEATARYGRIDVACEGCTVDLDGTLLEFPSFFVPASVEHRVSAVFDSGTVTETARAAAGQTVSLSFEAPPPTDDAPATGGPAESSGIGTLPPALAVTAMVLTAGAAATLVWSGVDTLSGVDAYEDMPTREGLEAGQDKERRTNILVGVTAAVGAATIALIVFTDWSGGPEEEEEGGAEVRVGTALLPGGARAVVEGRF